MAVWGWLVTPARESAHHRKLRHAKAAGRGRGLRASTVARHVSCWRASHLLPGSRSGIVQTRRQSSWLSPNDSVKRTANPLRGLVPCAGCARFGGRLPQALALMMKFVALVVIIILGSCSREPTPDDWSSVSAAVINTLYSQIKGDVSAAAICKSGRTNVSQEVLEKIKVQSIPLVKCEGVDSSAPHWVLRIKGSSKFAVMLSVDKIAFTSPTAATVHASYSYGGLHAEGFTFTVRKYSQGWRVVKQAELWVS